jgi:O-antigen/teichoic acid export membrane protein
VTDARSVYAFSDYLGLRLVTSSIAVILIALLALVKNHDTKTATVIVFIGLAKSFESVSDIFQGLFQKHEQMDCAAVSLILKGLLSVFMVGLALFFLHDIVVAVVMLAVAWGATVVFYDFPRGASITPNWRQCLRPRFRKSVFIELFLLTLPLGFLMMLLSFNDNLPRYFLVRHGGTAAVGIFSAMAYCVVAGGTLINAIGQAASPRLAKHYANGDLVAFRRILTKLMMCVVVAGTFGILGTRVAGRQLLELLYRPEYGQHADAFFWLIVAGTLACLSSVLGVGLTAMRVFKQQAGIRLFCTIVGLAASAVLIPSRGILGAAFVAVLLGGLGLTSYAALLYHELTHHTGDDAVTVPAGE